MCKRHSRVMNKSSTLNEPQHSILLVEDDLRLSALVVEYLEENNLTVATEFRGDTAVSTIINTQPDLVILDLMLPGLDGFEVCKQVRAQYTGPILMLTARDDDIDQVVGLELGADDYVVKPVQPRLLLARIRALLRRLTNQSKNPSATLRPEAQTKLKFDLLSISHSSRTVSLDNKVIDFSTSEFDLLWLLATHAGEILSREKISQALSGIEYDGLDRSIDIRISRLRKLLNDDPTNPLGIKTVRGQGYLFVSDGWQ